MAAPDDFRGMSELIGDIYDCAIDPGRWSATLERIGTVLRACNGQVMSRASDGLSFAATWGTSEEERRLYLEKFEAINPFTTMDWHFGTDEPVTVERFMPHEELRATRVYREYLQPRGWHDFVLTIVEKSASRIAMFGFTRHEREGFFGEEDLKLMAQIAPHVRRAVTLGGIIASASARADDLAATFQRLPTPTVLVDRDGRFVATNAAAERLFAPTADAAGAETLPVPRNGRRLMEARLASVLGRAAAPDSAAFSDAEGRALVAHVLPLGDAQRARLPAEARAVAAVFVQEVGAFLPLPGEVLVKLYGLTPAETRLLALLARGQGLDEAAEALGVKMATARTHLHRIFEKTGTSRQAELVRLVLSALPG